MKYLLIVLSFLLIFIGCDKEKDEVNNGIYDPYKLPWKTRYINYENITKCKGTHSSGYKLYYKDSLLLEDCIENGYIGISDSLLINDSILHLFFLESTSSYDLVTKNGGISWEQFFLGPPIIIKIQFVSTELIYTVTKNQNYLYFTGVGQSNLSMHKDSLTAGTHYILDSGAGVIGIDSTLITINDSVSFIIKFN